MFRLTALAVALLAASPAHADERACTTDDDCVARDTANIMPRRPPEPTRQRRALAALAAAGPGLLVHGAGSWLVYRKRTAKRLAMMEAVGLGGMLVGGLPVGISGGNPYSIVGVPILLAGAGLFASSWWSDIAVAAGIDRVLHLPPAAPPWSVELGTVWLHDPYRERGLGRVAGRVELGRFGAGAVALVDAENQYRDGELELRWRIRGAAANGEESAGARSNGEVSASPGSAGARSNGEVSASPGSAGARSNGEVSIDGSRLYVRSAVRVRHDDDDRLTVTTGEVEVVGRLDLAHVDGALAGTFTELTTGVGVERTKYAGDVHDLDSILLGAFAWGVYLGGRGEIAAFYDHRRDSIAGGLAASRAAGFVGCVGAYADVVVGPRWAVRGELDVGNAWVSTFVVRYRGGAR